MADITSINDYTDEPVKIPQAVNESSGVDENAGLKAVIAEREREILKKVLGDTQYATLQTELGKLPFNPQSGTNADQVYIDLVNGTGTWQGLKPMLTNYVFCGWVRETEIKLNATGPGKGRSEGFSAADYSSKFVGRWNVFVDMLGELKEYLESSGDLELPDDFPQHEYQNSLGL